ncbi:sigma-54-dependent Fis family transcriptional regulator [Desulfovibrio desulfuricans]|uniref:Sigma-54-dependent Fis family transcriptional regulator n=1 Tax=Desulfovibrio desulfuricans TaxID=876 RepID=A0A4P7ULM0_DESDE|nr:sigma-54 dependent transcriptional regulator [Desulfovibrio desulfuricans]QCC85814.1 sigma-54-dependent Fis family transcriptional regulator [Desulfovibrio desulfuricans]
MQRLLGLPSNAVICLLLMHYAEKPCAVEDITVLTAADNNVARTVIAQLCQRGMVLEDADGRYVPAEQCPNVDNIVTAIKKRNTASDSVLVNTLLTYYDKNYKKFLKNVISILHEHASNKRYAYLFFCYEYFAKLILRMRIQIKDRQFSLLFINSCMIIQQLSFKIPSRSRYQILLFYKAKGIAIIVGDRRNIGYIDINIGTLNITEKGIRSNIYCRRMDDGYNTIASICDKDIILRSADKIMLYYIINSRLNDAISFFLYINSMDEEDVAPYRKGSWFIYATMAASYAGNFKLAEEISILGIKKIELEKEDCSATDTLKAILAFIYFYTGKDAEGLEIIDEIISTSDEVVESYAALWATRALSFYQYKIGELEKSWSNFKKCFVEKKDSLQLHANYFIAAFVLDLMFAYQESKVVFPKQYQFFKELSFAEHSPFLILRGTALRIGGQILAMDGADFAAAEKKLRAALRLFLGIPAPILAANCLSSLAMLHVKVGEMGPARQEAFQAKMLFDALSPASFPTLLQPLIEDDANADLDRISHRKTVVTQFLQSLRSCMQTSVGDSNDVTPILAALMGSLGLVSGCVLEMTHGSLIPRGSINFPSDGGSTLRASLVHKSREMDVPLLRVLERGDDVVTYKNAVIVLHIPMGIYGAWFFYMQGTILRIMFNFLLRQHGAGLVEAIAVGLTAVIKNSKAVECRVTTFPVSNPQDKIIPLDMIVASKGMRKIIQKVDAVSSKDTAVLLMGESGCGKEMVAQRLHEKSRREGRFVCVNLSNLPYELFESECFGYEKGSFTGALQQKIGLFELADNGTLFIDEVGDIPLPIQVKLLRVLQNKTFMRIGGTKNIHSDFRLICATNRDLVKAVKSGTFREDLYYRINVVSINIPPLRAREEDIGVIAKYFLRYYAKHHNVPVHELTDEEMQYLTNYSWPGNVRQLRNFIERFCLLKDGFMEEISGALPENWPAKQHAASSSREKEMVNCAFPCLEEKPSLQELEDAYFTKIYKMTAGNVGGKEGLAAILKISRSKAYAWIERLRLRERYCLEVRPNAEFKES